MLTTLNTSQPSAHLTTQHHYQPKPILTSRQHASRGREEWQREEEVARKEREMAWLKRTLAGKIMRRWKFWTGCFNIYIFTNLNLNIHLKPEKKTLTHTHPCLTPPAKDSTWQTSYWLQSTKRSGKQLKIRILILPGYKIMKGLFAIIFAPFKKS